MTRLDVTGAGYVDGSALLHDGNVWAAHHYARLTGDLTGTGAMAGDSSFADRWAAEYDAAALAVLVSYADLVSALGNLGQMAFASWENHSRAELASTFGTQRVVDDVSLGTHDWVEVVRGAPPSALGGDPSSLPGWANMILDHVEGFIWPDADLDRLRATADTWRRAGQGLDDVATFPSRAVMALWTECSPEILPATGAIGRLVVATGDLADECRALAELCEGYATAVEEQREAILDLVRDMLRDAVLIQAAGFVLGLASFGSANGGAVAVNIAKIAAASPRFRRMLEVLRTYADTAAEALSGTRLAIAGVGARVKPMSDTRLLMSADVGKVGAKGGSATSFLARHEGGPFKGHTIRKHVGKSDGYLRYRLRKEKKSFVSTFTDEATAERCIKEVFELKSDRLAKFLAGDRMTTALQASVVNPGRVMTSTGEVVQGTIAHIKLRRDASMAEGYRIITAYVLP